MKPLPKDAGKETRGRVLIVGGSLRYPGAILLASRAALRCGAGVVTVAAARSVTEAIAGEDPNVTFFPLAEAQPGVVATGAAAQLSTLAGEKTRVMLLGPGLAHGPGTDDFVAAVLRNARALATVIDADGLNALARTEDWRALLPAKTILTPHDGEAARLAGRVVPAGAARVVFAERHARDWAAVVALKGPVTVVTDGKKTYLHDHPNPTLGVGGTCNPLTANSLHTRVVLVSLADGSVKPISPSITMRTWNSALTPAGRGRVRGVDPRPSGRSPGGRGRRVGRARDRHRRRAPTCAP